MHLNIIWNLDNLWGYIFLKKMTARWVCLKMFQDMAPIFIHHHSANIASAQVGLRDLCAALFQEDLGRGTQHVRWVPKYKQVL